MQELDIKILDSRIGSHFPIPTYQTAGSCGIDLLAMIEEPLTIEPHETKIIKSGISIFIKDPKYAGFIYPRSGLGTKHGIILANTTGVIDSDYQGELLIGLFNRSNTAYKISIGERIAQLVIQRVFTPKLNIVSEFSNSTERGEKGFGSTGS